MRVFHSVAHFPLCLAEPFQNNDVELHVVDALLVLAFALLDWPPKNITEHVRFNFDLPMNAMMQGTQKRSHKKLHYEVEFGVGFWCELSTEEIKFGR